MTRDDLARFTVGGGYVRVPNARLVLDTADEFLVAADLCNRTAHDRALEHWEKVQALDDLTGEAAARLAHYQERRPCTPAGVNLAFATELYLKCLHLVTTGSWIRGHDLKELFEKLPQPVRDCVRRHYAAQDEQRLAKYAERTGGDRDAAFDAILDETRNAFDLLRYQFAMRPFTTCVDRKLATAARRAVVENRPDLDASAEPAHPHP